MSALPLHCVAGSISGVIRLDEYVWFDFVENVEKLASISANPFLHPVIVLSGNSSCHALAESCSPLGKSLKCRERKQFSSFLFGQGVAIALNG